MLESRARRLPLVDVDDETRREMVVSVITQYRILKFVSVNVKETQMLRKPLRDVNIGTFSDLSTAQMDTPVMDVIHQLVRRNISCVPILDRDGTVLNVFEAVDVIALIKGGDYDNLNLSVGKALAMRSDVCYRSHSCLLVQQLRRMAGLPGHIHVHAQRPPRHHLRYDPEVARSPVGDHRRDKPAEGRAVVERYLGLHA